MSAGVALAWFGAVSGAVLTWIQLRRLRQVGTDGVSPLTWSLFAMMGLFWVSYGLSLHSVEMVAGTAMVAPFQIAVLVALGRRAWRAVAIATALVVVLTLVPAWCFGWAAGALMVGALMVATRFPQIRDLVTEPSVEGVAVGSWALSCVNLGAWLVYYAALHQTAAVASMVAAIASNVLIIWLTLRRHAHAQAVWARMRALWSR